MDRTVRACLACLLSFIASVFLAACGGGGGGSAPPPPGGDTIPPTVGATSPSTGQPGVAVTTVITATFSEPVGNVDETTFHLDASDGPVNGTVTITGNTATFTPSDNLVHLKTYTATVTRVVTDMAGNPLAADYEWSFTTGPPPDTTPPAVNSTTPSDGQTGVAVSTLVRATFSEAVGNVGPATFQLKDGAGVTVPGSATATGNLATYTPSAPLAYQTTYTATVTTGVTDMAGNRLAADCVWSFTTGIAPDTIRPTVSSTTPPGGQTAVAVSARVQATFSEAVTNVTASTFGIMAGAAPVAGSVTLDGSTATFTPSADLVYDTTYTATLTTGVRDLANNALAANYSWSFTTGAAPGPCLDCHGIGGSQAGVNGAPVITRYWQTSGHGRSDPGHGPPLQCADCHDVGTPAGAHATDGTGTFNTLGWPGKATATTNANTAHLKSFFFPVSPVAAADYAVAFDEACGNRLGCHARVGGGRIVKVHAHALWHTDDPDLLMEFGTHGSISDPKTFTWFVQTTYADDFYKSQSPWTIADMTTDAAGPRHYGTCVSCHDPHGTATTDLASSTGTNVMVRGNWIGPMTTYCFLSCHQ